ncbi:MAG: DUF742 domain-containing protein [Micromonosporaceae bacterium]
MRDEHGELSGALVRPYAVTRGRTRPRLNVAMEALLETTDRGRQYVMLIGSEQQVIASLCDGNLQSLAEISAKMKMALGVARVLVADMAAEGLLSIYEPTTLDNSDDDVGTELLERVLSGLRRL